MQKLIPRIQAYKIPGSIENETGTIEMKSKLTQQLRQGWKKQQRKHHVVMENAATCKQ